MESNKVMLFVTAAIFLSWAYMATCQITQPLPQQFPPLQRSDMLRAKALIRWLINNRTENNTKTFNAGFIRLAFHDCVGGCDGCLNLRNPSNTGLGFYKVPLDMMYSEFVFPLMSRADWYALAGLTAVEYAAELTPCNSSIICTPPMTFKWGRRDCLNESTLFRQFPGPNNDPRDTIRRNFRMNLLEITALMGAHTLGKNHGNGATWVNNESRFDNQYYKDMIDTTLQWRKGVRQGAASNTWSHGVTGRNIMFDSDFFMGFDLGTGFGDCNNNPVENCPKSATFESVARMAGSNDYWLRHFGTAFTVMLNNGNFGKLKDVVWDTFNDTFSGDVFEHRNILNITTTATPITNTTTSTTTTTTVSTTTTTTTTSSSTASDNAAAANSHQLNSTATNQSTIITQTGDISSAVNSVSLNQSTSSSSNSSSVQGVTARVVRHAPEPQTTTASLLAEQSTNATSTTTEHNSNGNTILVHHNTEPARNSSHNNISTSDHLNASANNTTTQRSLTTTGVIGEILALTFSNTTTVSSPTTADNTLTTISQATEGLISSVTTASQSSTAPPSTKPLSLPSPPRVIIENNEGSANTGDSRLGYKFEAGGLNEDFQLRLQNARRRLLRTRGLRRRQPASESSSSGSSSGE